MYSCARFGPVPCVGFVSEFRVRGVVPSEQGAIGRRDQLAGFVTEDLRTEIRLLIGRSFCTMAMEDEGQAKEIPLATAQPVHAHLGSLVESAATLVRYV